MVITLVDSLALYNLVKSEKGLTCSTPKHHQRYIRGLPNLVSWTLHTLAQCQTICLCKIISLPACQFILCMCPAMNVEIRGQLGRSQFSPSMRWVPGVELRLSGLVAVTFAYRAMPVAFKIL